MYLKLFFIETRELKDKLNIMKSLIRRRLGRKNI